MDSNPNAPTSTLEKPVLSRPASVEPASEFDALLKRGLNIWPFIRTIRRKALLIAGVTVLMTGFAALRTRQAPLTYQGDFELLVEPVTTQGRLADPSALTRGDVSAGSITDYATQLQILRSKRLLQEVVDAVKAQDPVAYEGFNIEKLERTLSVQRLGTGGRNQTKIIVVSYESNDPELVEQVLEATADRYLLYSLEERKTRFGEGIRFIDAQLPEIQERVSLLQDDLQQLRQRFSIVDPANQGERLAARAGVIEDLQFSTQRELRENIALRDRLQEQLNATLPEALSASSLSQNPQYQALLGELQAVESQIRTESTRFSAASPVIQQLEQTRGKIIDQLRAEAQTIVGSPVSPDTFVFQDQIRLELVQQLINTTNTIEVLEARSRQVAESQGEANDQLAQFPEIARRYAEIERELAISQQTLEQLLNQRELLRIESAQTEVPWELVSTPSIDRDGLGRPIAYPPSSKAVAFALVGGLIVGTGLALLLERWKDTFYTTEDVQDNLDIPLAGIVPYFGGLGQPATLASSSVAENGTAFSGLADQSSYQSSADLSKVAFAESFSALYASMRSPVSNDLAVRSIVISSAEPGDGKTTVAHNLAQTIAAVGKRVLLVDANLYNPTLPQHFDFKNDKGLGYLLTHGGVPGDVIYEQSPNLHVLPSGQAAVGSSPLLASSDMQALMQDLRQRYELVIYDAPHLMGLTDANFLASQTDGMYVVVGIGQTKRSVLMQVLSQLSRYKASVLGIVVNHLSAEVKNSYGYQARYIQAQDVQSPIFADS